MSENIVDGGNIADLALNATLALDGSEQGIIQRAFWTLINLIYNVVATGCFFACAMAGMVYFKQDGMLYHPAVPDERYRYP